MFFSILPGCTTFSFALNLGVYLRGSTFERRAKNGPDGNPRPREYQCSFRANVKTRTSVDGFAREDSAMLGEQSSAALVFAFDEARKAADR